MLRTESAAVPGVDEPFWKDNDRNGRHEILVLQECHGFVCKKLNFKTNFHTHTHKYSVISSYIATCKSLGWDNWH